ncbi:hypothetical protein H257_07860 [Aphanomyces astaci]|uniref:EF-hand domain-containing protein n=1 Tax=Aphanomyces astaci TaxID=112090 RepID=W4GHF5_APHAT|nr:hypothetical protein H257_07860 [Aphanomyces astaci]ETV79125.1 hypothetical protein H257_07860 [Aphanomyces astaci]|eukprot:XP_009831844.1 hypothetical protein H257_07860 [Aphanomyces astaci]
MNHALLVYKPRKRVRKKPSEKLEPLVAKRVARKWQRDATACFVETDLYLRWRDKTHDDRLGAVQATWALMYGHSSDIYRVLSPEPSTSATTFRNDQSVADNNNNQSVDKRAVDATVQLQATDNVPLLLYRLRLRKVPPQQMTPLVHETSATTTSPPPPTTAPFATSSRDSNECAVVTLRTTGFTRHGSRYSIEMRRQLDAHLREKMAGNLWQNEVRSVLARPLDATVFVNRVEQLDHIATSQSFAGFESRVPQVATDKDVHWRYPYSAHAHNCARMIRRCYQTSCDRRNMQQKLRQLVRSTRFVQDFLRFRVHCKVQRRQRRAVQSLVARRLQRPMRSYLATKHTSARQIQSRWRQVLAKRTLATERRMHRAATSITRACKQFVLSLRRRHVLASRIQTIGRAWLWRRRGRLAEAERREVEWRVMKEASKVAMAASVLYFMTADGKAEVKRERKRMRENVKLAKTQQGVQAATSSSPPSKDDLETLAIRHSFDTFDTDGSGSIDVHELRLLLSELGIPISDRELQAGFQEMDTDGSGTIDFDEFAAWWKHGLTAGKAKTQMALLRLKLRGRSLVHKITGAEARAQAAKRIASRRRVDAMIAARDEFRNARPPVSCCHMCHMAFGLDQDWFVHTRHHCAGRDELHQLPPSKH